MNGNPFFIQPAGDIGQGLAGLGSIINQKQMQEREIGIQDAERARQEAFRKAQSEALGIDPVSGQPIGIQQEEYVPKISRADMFDAIMDPKAARYEGSALEEMGITPDKYDEVKEFSNKFLQAPNEERRQLALDRIKTITERGGDARDTAKLLMMPREEADKVLNVVDMIVDRQALRRMAAIDPIATQNMLNSSRAAGDSQTDFTRKLSMFSTWRDMPEGEEKDAFGMMLGAVPRGRSVEDALRLEEAKNKGRVDVAEKVEKIKTDEDIIREMNRQTKTPEGMADVAKKNMEIIALQSAEEAKIMDAKGTMELLEKMEKSDLDKIYGRGESIIPELLRSQSGIDMLSDRDRLVNVIKLGSRGQLKGQGAVSDTETKMLADAATVLGRPNISPDAARDEIRRIKPTLDRILKSSQKSISSGSGAAQDDAKLFEKYGL